MNTQISTGENAWLLLLVDRFPLRRNAFRYFLEHGASAENQACQVMEAGSIALPACRAKEISAVLVDLGSMAPCQKQLQDMIAATEEFAPERPVVVVSDHWRAADVAVALGAGVKGFISTDMAPAAAIRALSFIIGGGVFFPAEALLEQPEPKVPAIPAAEANFPLDESTFTQRQRQVLLQLRRGYSNKLIGRELHMCESTVKVHVRQIMRKLGVSNRTQVALRVSAQADACIPSPPIAALPAVLASPPAKAIAQLLPLRA
ncbi:LuxR C-terminal-related transcriptional regulator [Teichococcus oryzae]|nr:response regulator transcription factor [Pseudoroseomonas oryzae]